MLPHQARPPRACTARSAYTPPPPPPLATRTEYDKTITETEAAYSKIMESSQTLLHVLKRESVNLTKKRQVSS